MQRILIKTRKNPLSAAYLCCEIYERSIWMAAWSRLKCNFKSLQTFFFCGTKVYLLIWIWYSCPYSSDLRVGNKAIIVAVQNFFMIEKSQCQNENPREFLAHCRECFIAWSLLQKLSSLSWLFSITKMNLSPENHWISSSFWLGKHKTSGFDVREFCTFRFLQNPFTIFPQLSP